MTIALCIFFVVVFTRFFTFIVIITDVFTYIVILAERSEGEDFGRIILR